jgi:hypothetical protein
VKDINYRRTGNQSDQYLSEDRRLADSDAQRSGGHCREDDKYQQQQ